MSRRQSIRGWDGLVSRTLGEDHEGLSFAVTILIHRQFNKVRLKDEWLVDASQQSDDKQACGAPYRGMPQIYYNFCGYGYTELLIQVLTENTSAVCSLQKQISGAPEL